MNRKIILAVVLVAIGVAVWYFLLRKSSGGVAGLQAAVAPGLGPEDTAAYNKMVALFKAEADPGAINWLLPHVVTALNGTNANPISDDYKLNGKDLSKAGAFLAIYAAAYHGGSESKFSGKKPGDPGFLEARQAFNDKIYNIFYEFKTAYLNKQLSA